MPKRKKQSEKSSVSDGKDDLFFENVVESNEKLSMALESDGLVLRNEDGTLNISPILSEFLSQISGYKHIIEGNTTPANIEILFPVVNDEKALPSYSFWEVKVTPPEDTSSVRTSVHPIGTTSKDVEVRNIGNRLPTITINRDMRSDNNVKKFNLSLSSSLSIPTHCVAAERAYP